MNKKYVRLILGITILGFLAPVSIQAQIVPDATLPTISEVNPPQDGVIQIDGGTIRDSNLFHSFQEFSVQVGQEAFFNNAETISNILSRVTGGNISNIDGSIRTIGTANLFLINPAGIVFGENASLNVGGSFIGSTADSIIFDGFEYSATNPQAPPLITINAPIGLNFRDDPQPIIYRSVEGLEVPADQTLALIGGDVFIAAQSFLFTPGGRIEIGSIAGNSNVSLNQVDKGWDVSYEEVENFRDISVTEASQILNNGENTGDIEVQGRNISVIEASQIINTGENTGDIEVQGRNISLTEGSQILIDTLEGQAGNLTIIASESLELSGNGAEIDFGEFATEITSIVDNNASGEESKLTIQTDKLTLKNGGRIFADSFSRILADNISTDRGIDIDVKASEIIVEGSFSFDQNFPSNIINQVDQEGVADGGNITITTETLTVKEGGRIATETFGAGDAGNLIITASESIELSGTISDSNNFPSAFFAGVGEDPNAKGNGGDLNINTPRLTVRDGAQISTVAQNTGNAGKLTINVDESILLTGTAPVAEFRGTGRSGIFVNVQSALPGSNGEPIPTTGNGGTLKITAEDLTVENGANVTANTFSAGSGGNATIDVNKLIVRGGGEIQAGSVFNREGGEIVDDGVPRGMGGTLDITADESVEVTGTGNINDVTVKSSINTLAESSGNAGNLTITTENLTVSNGAEIDTSTSGQGDAGNAGNLTINTENLTVSNGAKIDTRTTAEIDSSITDRGNAGDLTINTTENLIVSGEGAEIDSSTIGRGDAGSIIITTKNLTVSDGGEIDVRTTGEGAAGNIDITANSIDLTNGSITASTNAGNKGNITLNIDENLTLRDNSLISTKATEGADGGDVTINSQFIIAYPSQRPENGNDIVANARLEGTGGNIKFNVESFFGLEERSADEGNGTNDIDVSSEFGLDGDFSIESPDNNTLQEVTPEPKIVESPTLGLDACSGRVAAGASTFVVKGKGGIPPVPTEPFMADALIPDGKPITLDKETDLNSFLVGEIEKNQENPNYIPADIKPIKTSLGDIYPARGIVKTEDGKIILTRYPTDNINPRTPHNSANCTPS